MTRFVVRPGNGVEEFTLTDEELVRVCLPDPTDPFAAYPPLRAAAVAAHLDEAVQVSQLSSLERSARPKLKVKIGQPDGASNLPGAGPRLTAAQRQALEVRFAQAYAGSDRHGLPIIVDGGFIQDVEPLFEQAAELDYAGSTRVVAERVLTAFGVNGVSIGINEDANRASSVVADESLVFNVVGPLAVLIGQTLTRAAARFFGDPDLVVWVEPPRPRNPDLELAEREQLARYGCLTVNEMRAEAGYDPRPGPEGDQLVKAGPAPAAAPPREAPARADERAEVVRPSRNGHKRLVRE
jgi:phage portal protein BeeE